MRRCDRCGGLLSVGQPGRHWACSPVCPKCVRRVGPAGENCECRTDDPVPVAAVAVVTDHQLFHADPESSAPAKRRKRPQLHPADVDRIDDDDRWRMISTRRGVDGVAHLIVSGGADGASAGVLCGQLVGRALSLDGARPPACPVCLRRRVDGKPQPSRRRRR